MKSTLLLLESRPKARRLCKTMVLVRPPLNNRPQKSVSNANVKAERISTVDILLISSCFRLSDK